MKELHSLLRPASVILVACAAWSMLAFAGAGRHSPPQKSKAGAATTAEGLMAWRQVYSVLTHPRCINCHTATNYPQQGDDRHRHFANVVRGPDDKGVPALQCVTCHQDANADSTGVPGAHDWRLAPLSMAWQDVNDKILSSAEVCRAITDRSKNHNLDGPGLLKHHTEEALVLWAFQPSRRIDGTARTLPPLTREELVEATRKWVEAGTPCPQNAQIRRSRDERLPIRFAHPGLKVLGWGPRLHPTAPKPGASGTPRFASDSLDADTR